MKEFGLIWKACQGFKSDMKTAQTGRNQTGRMCLKRSSPTCST